MTKGDKASIVLDNLLTRRSVRRFAPMLLAHEDLETIVQAARFAPSGRNKQLWRFTVVQRPDRLEALRQVIGHTLGRDTYDFYGAPVLILASNERNNPHGLADCACALENMFLAAHALDIGSVWINQLTGICDEPAVRAVLDTLSLPISHLVWGAAALGYAEGPAPYVLKRSDVVTWVD